MSIEKIEIGTVNDDFIHNRITAKVINEKKEVCLLKIYKGGKIVSCHQTDFDYLEKEISQEMLADLHKCKKIKVHFIDIEMPDNIHFSDLLLNYK